MFLIFLTILEIVGSNSSNLNFYYIERFIDNSLIFEKSINLNKNFIIVFIITLALLNIFI